MIRLAMYLVAVVVAFSLSACGSTAGLVKNDNASEMDSRKNDRTRDRRRSDVYCRIGQTDSGEKKWKIYKVTLNDFINIAGGDYYYQIVKSWDSPPPSSSRIELRDAMDIFKDSQGRVILRHRGQHSSVSIDVETQGLILEEDLWVKGKVLSSDGRTEGIFYVYRRADKTNCKHTNNRYNYCRSFHFEYFDAGVTDDFPIKKVEGSSTKANVFPIGDPECSRPLQTDDGDGDEGLR